jgi:flagellar FliL protein
MSSDGGQEGAEAPGKAGKKKLVLIAAPVLLLGAGAGLWFGGILPPLLGMGGKVEAAAAAPPAPSPPGFVELPEIVTNLNVPAAARPSSACARSSRSRGRTRRPPCRPPCRG